MELRQARFEPLTEQTRDAIIIGFAVREEVP
jgi:hypothetical protein